MPWPIRFASLNHSKTAEHEKKQQLCCFNGLCYLFSHDWLPTVQDVLHADWQEVWHSPQPPWEALSLSEPLFNVLICFIVYPPYMSIDLQFIIT